MKNSNSITTIKSNKNVGFDNIATISHNVAEENEVTFNNERGSGGLIFLVIIGMILLIAFFIYQNLIVPMNAAACKNPQTSELAREALNCARFLASK